MVLPPPPPPVLPVLPVFKRLMQLLRGLLLGLLLELLLELMLLELLLELLALLATGAAAAGCFCGSTFVTWLWVYTLLAVIVPTTPCPMVIALILTGYVPVVR